MLGFRVGLVGGDFGVGVFWLGFCSGEDDSLLLETVDPFFLVIVTEAGEGREDVTGLVFGVEFFDFGGEAAGALAGLGGEIDGAAEDFGAEATGASAGVGVFLIFGFEIFGVFVADAATIFTTGVIPDGDGSHFGVAGGGMNDGGVVPEFVRVDGGVGEGTL